MKNNKWTGERLETFIFTRDMIDHLHRYAFALELAKNKMVLDIACGEGYGSHLLSKVASLVTGVDIDADVISKAQTKYIAHNLRFVTGNTSAIPLGDDSVDVVVSYETIEHHDAHQEMMVEIKRVLKPDGIIVISTPDKLHYSDRRNFSNPFHKKELYKSEFAVLLSSHFKHIQLLKQVNINHNSFIYPEGGKRPTIFTGDYLEIAEIQVEHRYLVIVASDENFPLQTDSIFEGSRMFHYAELSETKRIYESYTYRVGDIILRPFKLLMRYFK